MSNSINRQASRQVVLAFRNSDQERTKDIEKILRLRYSLIDDQIIPFRFNAGEIDELRRIIGKEGVSHLILFTSDPKGTLLENIFSGLSLMIPKKLSPWERIRKALSWEKAIDPKNKPQNERPHIIVAETTGSKTIPLEHARAYDLTYQFSLPIFIESLRGAFPKSEVAEQVYNLSEEFARHS